MKNSTKVFTALIFLFLVIQDGETIYGGTLAVPGQFKYSVLLHIAPTAVCSGSIISENHVLTAGHCVYDVKKEDILVVVKNLYIFGDRFTIFRNVEKITVHQKFRQSDTKPSTCKLCIQDFSCFLEPRELNDIPKNDIAVLTLDEPLDLAFSVEAVPYKPPTTETLCTTGRLAGWGKMHLYADTYHLRWTVLSILTPEECENRQALHRDNEFCAMDLNRKSVTLEGDSGSALVCDGYAVGVLSTGAPHVDWPATFARISDHLDFIDGVVNSIG